jgi:hypothetical protein
MRTVFVNPTRRRRRRKRSNPRRRRRAARRNSAVQLSNPRRRRHRRRRNSGIAPFVQNPQILSNPRRRRRRRNPGAHVLADLAYIFGGTIGGAALNRLAFGAIGNFYVRNGARVASAALLAYIGGRNTLTAAAAGATLAPILAEIETLISHTAPAKANPQELAAELSALLEADLSDDGDLSDDDLSDDQLEADLSDDLIDDDLIDDDLEDIASMRW